MVRFCSTAAASDASTPEFLAGRPAAWEIATPNRDGTDSVRSSCQTLNFSTDRTNSMTTLEPDTTAAITATVTTYLDAVARGSSADIAALYAENATLEDPVGSEPRVGKAAITEFYGALEGGSQETELLTLRVSGSSAAFHFRVVTPVGDQVYEVEPIDVMTFDADAKITSMRAFWSPADLIAR
jgi:steroid delta-isomerase